MHIHESPVDQDFVGHESRDKQKRQSKAKRHKIQRQLLAAEALDFVSATAIASDVGTVDAGVGGVSLSSTSQQRKRQHQPSAQATASAIIASPSQASDESHDVIAESTQIGNQRGVKANSPLRPRQRRLPRRP